jgi:hypothetical protein
MIRQAPATITGFDRGALAPDWMGDLLFNDAPPWPAKRPFKRDKVSLAAQLEESSLKVLGKKKAISLKDHFRHLESYLASTQKYVNQPQLFK